MLRTSATHTHTHVLVRAERGHPDLAQRARPLDVINVRVLQSFQQPMFQNITNTNSYCVFESRSYLFASREILKRRLLKRLLAHPTKYVSDLASVAAAASPGHRTILTGDPEETSRVPTHKGFDKATRLVSTGWHFIF